MQEIHDREGEVVEQVRRRHVSIELDGVEQNRLLSDHHDIGEMRIAMAAADQPGRSTPLQQGEMIAKMPVGKLMQPFHVAGRQHALLAKLFGIAVDDGPDRRRPLRLRGDRRERMGRMHRLRQCVRRAGRNGAGPGEMIEGVTLVEAGHLHGPLDGGAFAVQCKAVWLARDRHHPAIDTRRITGVDGEFLLTAEPALLQRRVVEEGQPDRTLDLEHAILREEHDRNVGVDALRGHAGAGARGEKCQYLVLIACRRFHGAHAAS